MPEMISFKITQTRDIEVWANDPVSALAIAQAGFENGLDRDGKLRFGDKPFGVEGDVTRRIIERDIRVERKS